MPVLLAALGVLLVSLDASVNIAFPSMGAAFGAGPATIRWVIVCYVLTYAITSFLAGLLADRVGPGPVFAAGVWLSAACFLTILAVPSLGPFLAVRVAQGVAAGLVYGTAPALVTLALPRERHGRGLGLMTLGMGAGLAIGPLVGGVLVEAFGWRSVFVYRAPLAVGLGLLARPGPASPRAAVPALSLEGLAEIGRPAVLGTLAQTFLANGAQFAVWLLVPFYLVDVRGLSPSAGGALFMLMPLGTAAAAPLAGLATDRLGPAWPLVSGLVLEGLGLLGISRLSSESAVPLVGLALGMVGLGLGIFQVPNLAQTMRSFPVSRQGAAGGLAFTSRTLGVVNGVEMAAALFGSPGAGAPFLDGFARALLGAAAVCGLAAGLAALASAAPRRRAA